MLLHSAVQPPVKALGNQAMITGFLPAKSAKEYCLPSEPCNLKSGALSPTFGASAQATEASKKVTIEQTAKDVFMIEKLLLVRRGLRRIAKCAGPDSGCSTAACRA